MKTKTYTVLVTVRDDGMAAVFNPDVLAAAIAGALESGIPSFMLDSTTAAKLGVRAGEHNLAPVVSAAVDAFEGEFLNIGPMPPAAFDARRLHRNLRDEV
jgi:hypothetical protein